MTETSNPYCAILAKHIQNHFEEGIYPGPGVRHYIDSTFAYPTRRDLEKILTDLENCESDTLMELIFFPGQRAQLMLENIIEKGRFQKNEEGKILRILMAKKTLTTFCYPEKNTPVRFSTPEHAAGQFIARLDITKKLDHRLIETIHRRLLQEKDQMLMKVMIRNARFTCRGKKAEFLKSVLLGMNSKGNDFFEYLKFVLYFLEISPSRCSLKKSLANLKEQLQDNIHKAEQFETLRRNRNVETMILQGIRIPHFDTRDDMQKVVMIDAVGLAIYGRPP